MQRMCFAVLIGLAAFMATAAGCSPYATYPPLDGSGQVTGPAIYPAPELMAQAIRYAHERSPTEELIINLPTGTPSNVYDVVIQKIGEGRPMLLPDEPAFHVEAVRIRGFDADVDVIYPQASGHYDFITIYFHRGLVAKYDVTGTRMWRVRVEAPQPRYQPPTEITKAGSPDDAGSEAPQPIFGTPQP